MGGCGWVGGWAAVESGGWPMAPLGVTSILIMVLLYTYNVCVQGFGAIRASMQTIPKIA